MKNYKYYPPEAEGDWKDFLFKYWEWFRLGFWFVVSILLIILWIYVCSWLGNVIRGCV